MMTRPISDINLREHNAKKVSHPKKIVVTPSKSAKINADEPGGLFAVSSNFKFG